METMNPFRFAVFGDTHYTLRPKAAGHAPAADDDFARYAAFKDNLPRFAQLVRTLLPDGRVPGGVAFAMHTGDRIQGWTDDPREDAESIRILDCGGPMHLARGSHDFASPMPRYRSFDHGGCRFILLDYTDWSARQRDFLEAALARSRNARRVFVFSHAPLHAWGREFFDNPAYRQDVEALLQQYRVDVLFCGHTHNQSFSSHASGYLQAMLSTVGEPAGKPVPLTRYHALPARDARNHFLGGVLEDSDPAVLAITVDSDALLFERVTLHGSRSLKAVARRWDEADFGSLFGAERPFGRVCAADLAAAQEAYLVVFHTEKDGFCHATVTVNGIAIGTLPENSSYANRRRIPLPPEALRTLRTRGNVVEIAPPLHPPVAIGSLSLETRLPDARVARTVPNTHYFTCGIHRDFVYGEQFAEQISPDRPIRVTLDF